MDDFQKQLRKKMDEYAHLIYKITRKFPKEEIYGLTSQLRRAAMSVVLNYIEGFARQRKAVKKNFWEISYGSLKESKYILHFTLVEGYTSKTDYEKAVKLAEEIGKMLWHSLKSLE